MDLHVLPHFSDGKFDVRQSTYAVRAIALHGRQVELPSSFSPPLDHDLAVMMQARCSMGDDLESSTTFSETSFQQSPNNDQDGDTMDAGSDKDEEDLTFEKELPPSMPDDSCIGGITEAIAQCQTYRVRMQQLRVFVPCTDPSDGTQVLHKLHVAVPETARAPDVIVLALQQLQGEQANVPPEQRFFFHTNPNFYRLRVAEDDTGTIEEDVPALDWNSKVNRLDTLVMCCSDGSESGSSRDPIQPARKTLEDLTFFVNYVRQSRTTRRRLSLPPDVLYRDLLGLVCEKLNRDPKKHQIKLVLGGVYRTSLSDGSLPTEKTLTTLYHTFAVHEFALEPLGPEAEEEEDDEVDAAPEEDDGRGVLYTEYDASKYQEFHVIKINKWGVRQPRILGMDRSTIYNMMPKREKTLVGSVRRTQHPDRGIEDIEAIRQPDPTRPLYFEVDYKNKQTPTDRIECLTKRDAQELLSKLRFLIELHRPEQQKRGGARVDRRVLGTGMARFRTGMGAIMHTLSDVPDDLVKKLKGELIPTSAEY